MYIPLNVIKEILEFLEWYNYLDILNGYCDHKLDKLIKLIRYNLNKNK